MEKFFDSSSSLLAEYDVNSKGHKRKESSNEGKECSSAATSSNVPWPSSGMKLQKTSETSASSNLLHRLDSREFGSVAKQIGVLEARKLHLLQLFSKLNSRSQLSHLELEKKRLVNQQTIRVTQSDIINLENEPPRVHMIAGDVPIVILNSDDEDGGYQEHYHTYQKDVLIELAHQLPDKALTVNDSQEVKAPKFTAKSIPASYDTQVDEIAYTDTENDKKVKENEKVIVSRNVVGSSPANCNILANEIAYARKVNGVQFINIERFEASGNVVGNSITKCNIQVDLNTSADMVRKDKNHQIDVGDNSLAKNDTENDTHVRDKVSRDAVRAKCNNQVDESAQNNMIVENGNHHHIDVGDNSLAKKDSGNDTHVRDKGSWNADRAKCNIQVDESADSGKNNIIVENDNHQLDVEDYGLTKIGIENDIEDRDCTKFKAVSDVEGSPTKCNNQLYESAFVGKESNIVIEQDNHQVHVEDDDLDKIWKEMSFALECCKDSVADPATDECVEEHGEECDHSFILKDDLGHVCRICGVIWRSIDTIIEFQSAKVKRSSRTYAYECRITNSRESIDVIPGLIKSPNIMVTEIAAHPRHRKEMKPHQVEGFNFLCSNLVTDDPGGCILAHAPGSGKTFMIISFIQSFLAKYPDARPLVVLPKGIMATWKNEFLKWQVDEIRLHDFYSSKAENRSQQLDILKKWVKERSILFLGYKQLSVIVCDNSRSKEAAECQDILLKVPTILILDEGHTPRNEETDVLQSLSKVRTPRKVVLSGTLYQNHVKEVFNILNLVRPRFLKLKASRMIVNRVLGRVEISKVRKHLKAGTDSAFFDLVEYTLQKDEDFRRRKAVIQDLREMTSNVLHYYKGDFLDELPGLVDFTAVLNLSPRQKDEVQTLRKLDKFKRTSLGSAMYIHPQLKSLSQMCSVTGEKGSIVDDEKIDAMLQELDIREGVKAKFFLTILGLCESAGEKLLVFSQYILPLKLLERLSAKMKGWKSGREIFMITGDSSTEQREWCMEHFNSSPNARVFFGSIKACGEGISLVGASRILILDVHLNPSVTRQAIGRAFRPGQKKKVYTYRLVAADSPEQEDYLTCSRKELISKTWFEWNENCADQDFEVKTIDVHECGDIFFESLGLREDLNVLYKR